MKENRKIIFGFIGIILFAAVIFLFIFKNNEKNIAYNCKICYYEKQ